MSMAPVKASKIVGVFFVVIDLFVSVCIMENGNLAAIKHEDSILVHMDTDGLIESGGIPLPGNTFEVI